MLNILCPALLNFYPENRQHSSKGRVVNRSLEDCLIRDRMAAGSNLTDVIALWSMSKTHLFPSLVLVQHRKTRPYINERLLMGRKESNQTKSIPVISMFLQGEWKQCGS